MKNYLNTVCAYLVAVVAVWFIVFGPFGVLAGSMRNSGQLQTDANNIPIQQCPAASLSDNLALSATITNLALTSNVVTITATHAYVVGQKVTINLATGPALFADCNGTFVIASVSTTVSFTYALTHANISTGAATGTAKAYQLSPVATGTSEVKFVFPSKAYALIMTPTDATDATFSYTSGGGVGGTYPLYQNTANVIAGTETDTVYVQRTTTTKLSFQFALTR